MKTSYIVLSIVLLILVWLNAFCLTEYWHSRTYWTMTLVEIGEIKNPETHDTFFDKVVNFYETLIYYQFGIIGALLVLCFLYTHMISHRQAREVVDEEMQSKSFEDKIERMGRKIITELFNNNPELFNDDKVDAFDKKIKNMSSRMLKLEKAIKNLANDIEKKSSKIQNTVEEVKNGNDPQKKIRSSARKKS